MNGQLSNFAKLALGDPEGRNLERVGVPDDEPGSSLVVREVSKVAITHTAGGDLLVINWPFFMPTANGKDYLVPQERHTGDPGDNVETYTYQTSANGIRAGGLCAYAVPSGTQIFPNKANPDTFTQPTTTVKAQPSDAMISGRGRLVGLHIKVDNTSNPIQVTGSKIQFSQKATYEDTPIWFKDSNNNVDYVECADLNMPACVEGDITLLPDNEVGKAADGAFQPVVIDYNDDASRPRYLKARSLRVRGPSGYDTSGLPCSAATKDMFNWSDRHMQGLQGNAFLDSCFEVKRFLSTDYSGVLFQGVQAGATFDLTLTTYFEKFPDPFDPANIDQAVPRPISSGQELEIVNNTFRQCPLFFNSCDNGSGLAWGKIGSSLKSVATKVASPVKALAGPVIKEMAKTAISGAVAQATAINPMLGVLAREASNPLNKQIDKALTSNNNNNKHLAAIGNQIAKESNAIAKVVKSEVAKKVKKAKKKLKIKMPTMPKGNGSRNGKTNY